MAALDRVKTLLGFTDTQNDELLNQVISLTSDRLKVRLGADQVPDQLEYIVAEVAVARFNRIGSEGLSSHSVEGESMSWSDDDFAPYQDDIEAYNDSLETSVKGRVRFL